MATTPTRAAHYVAVIGDLIASRALPRRGQIQEELATTLAFINTRYASAIASRFTLTLGDEFQGLLTTMSDLFEILDVLRFRHPALGIRFGIGIGAIDTAIDPKQSLGADGPAYWQARAALARVHDRNDYGKSRMRLESSLAVDWIELVNNSLRLCDQIESRWRSSQRAFVAAYVLAHGHDTDVKQTTLAAELGTRPQDVNQKLRASGLYQWLAVRTSIGSSLQTALEQAEKHQR